MFENNHDNSKASFCTSTEALDHATRKAQLLCEMDRYVQEAGTVDPEELPRAVTKVKICLERMRYLIERKAA